MAEAKLVVEVIQWLTGIVLALVQGVNSPDAERLEDILPPNLRADVEHARQRRLTEQALEGVG